MMFHRSVFLAFVVGGLIAANAMAQQPAQFSGPVSGYLFDAPSRAIRLVSGVPGSAYLAGAAISECDYASIAPNGLTALVVRDRQWLLAGDIRSANTEPVRDIEGLPALVAWSADSTAGAIVLAESKRVVLRFRISSGAASLEAPIELENEPSALAVSEAAVFASFETGVYRLEAGKAPALLVETSGPSAVIAMNQKTGSLFAAHGSPLVVTEVVNPSGFAETNAALPALEGLAEVVGLGFSRDGKMMYVAGRGDAHVLLFDLEKRALAGSLSWDAPPAFVEPLGSGSMFLLRRRIEPGDSILALDSRLKEPSIFFIPAGE